MPQNGIVVSELGRKRPRGNDEGDDSGGEADGTRNVKASSGQPKPPALATAGSKDAAAVPPRTSAPNAGNVGKIGEGSMTLAINDRMGKKLKISCDPDSTIADIKKKIAELQGKAKSGKLPKYRLQRANAVLRDHMCVEDYELVDGGALDLYYD